MRQVHKAFDYLEAFEGPETPDVRYEVRVRRSDSSAWQRGIYLREPLHASHPVSFMVEVQPTLHEVRSCRMAAKLHSHKAHHCYSFGDEVLVKP